MDNDKLIARLRKYGQSFEAYQNHQYADDMQDAAEAIEALASLCKAYEAQNKKLRNDRDAARKELKDLKFAMKHPPTWKCGKRG